MGLVKGWCCWQDPINSYEIGTDDHVRKVGVRSGFVRSIESTGQFGAIMQKIDAQKYKGKRVRFTGFLKCKDVQKSCGFFLEVYALQPADNTLRAIDDMHNRSLSRTTDWTMCELVLDVAPDAFGINIGARLIGAGQLWIDGLKFEEVGPDVAVTDEYRRYPREPQNLEFIDEA